MKHRTWVAWNVIFVLVLLGALVALLVGFLDKKAWSHVWKICLALTVALFGTGFRIAVRPRNRWLPLAFTCVLLIGVAVVTGAMLLGAHGTANKVDWLLPLLLVGYGQASRWIEEPPPDPPKQANAPPSATGS